MSKRRALSVIASVALVGALSATVHAFPFWIHWSHQDASGNEVGYRHLLCDGSIITSGRTTGRVVMTRGDCTP